MIENNKNIIKASAEYTYYKENIIITIISVIIIIPTFIAASIYILMQGEYAALVCTVIVSIMLISVIINYASKISSLLKKVNHMYFKKHNLAKLILVLGKKCTLQLLSMTMKIENLK